MRTVTVLVALALVCVSSSACAPTTVAAAVASACMAARPAPTDEDIAQCLAASDGPPPEGTIAVCTRTLQAAGLSDDERSFAYLARGDALCDQSRYDEGIADFDKAIALRPRLAEAYADRGHCRFNKRGDANVASGLADYDHAIALAPRSPCFHEQQAHLLNLVEDDKRVLADYDAAIRLAPRFNIAMDERAKTLFALGRFDEAAAQWVTVIRLTPGDPYPVLWLHIARARAHEPDAAEFQAGIKTLDLNGWPGPIFDLFLGRTSLTAMRQAGYRLDDGREGECQGAIFGGEYALTKGDETTARPLFEEAASVCHPYEYQYVTAWAEYKRLVPDARNLSPWSPRSVSR